MNYQQSLELVNVMRGVVDEGPATAIREVFQQALRNKWIDPRAEFDIPRPQPKPPEPPPPVYQLLRQAPAPCTSASQGSLTPVSSISGSRRSPVAR